MRNWKSKTFFLHYPATRLCWLISNLTERDQRNITYSRNIYWATASYTQDRLEYPSRCHYTYELPNWNITKGYKKSIHLSASPSGLRNRRCIDNWIANNKETKRDKAEKTADRRVKDCHQDESPKNWPGVWSVMSLSTNLTFHLIINC